MNENIQPLNIGGLQGRMTFLPAQEKADRKILLIYGLHSSLERWRTTAEFHNRFGEVTMPDLPGFGGMDSFYKIGKEPTLDNYADYLYSFMKSRKLTKGVTVVSMSFGSTIVTRMLQKHPDAVEFFADNVAIVGFGKHTDFTVSPITKRVYITLSRLFKTKIGSWLVSTFVFNPLSLRVMFAIFRLFNPKYKNTLGEERKAGIRMELDLWRKNDTRTKFYTYELIFRFDLTRQSNPIKMAVYNMYTKSDQYFDAKRVADTFSALYTEYRPSVATSELHAPSVMGTPDEIENMYSDGIKDLLSHD